VVAEPGVDPAAVAAGTDTGGQLLCVGTVTPAKGHDVLVEALSSLADMGWSCTCVGSIGRDPAFAERLRAAAEGAGIAERVRLAGVCSDPELERLFGSSDLLVHPSRAETYGMVVAEALAHGLPVVASDVGGVPEALGRTPSGRPGLLVPPGDAGALGGALRRWLGDGPLRSRLRAAARDRRAALHPWSATAEAIARACRAAAR
jgi:glycosyltransferase involved in cell wall biosynthesis